MSTAEHRLRFAWINERPFGYLAEGRVTGCDVVLARTASARAGFTLDLVHTTFAEMLPGLAAGRWDVTTGVFTTPERSRAAHFTRPVWSLSDGLLVRREDRPGVGGYRELAAAIRSGGGRVAVLRDQVQAGRAVGLGVPPTALLVLETYDDAVAAVVSGTALAYASVALAHEQALAAGGGAGLACVRVPESEVPASPGAFACADPAVRDALDAALAGVLGEGVPGEPADQGA